MSDSMTGAIDVAFEKSINIETKSTEQLTAEINAEYHQAEQLAGMSAMMLAEAGRRLLEVKERIPHGEFGEWCKNNLEFSYRKAARMMQLAKKMDEENGLFTKMPTLATIEISRVWALLAAPEEVAAEVVETNDIESITVRELKAELARVKEEKEAADRKAEMIDHNNDDIRKELASMQRKLSETVSEEEFEEMQAAAQAQKEGLVKDLQEAQSTVTDIQAKLDKAKEELRLAKQKLKVAKESKDEEVKEQIEKVTAEISDKAKKEADEAAKAEIDKARAQVGYLTQQIEKLEAEKVKLSNTSLMEFKTYVDMLQDLYFKICDLITEENLHDQDMGAKMQKALHTMIDKWRP